MAKSVNQYGPPDPDYHIVSESAESDQDGISPPLYEAQSPRLGIAWIKIYLNVSRVCL